MTFTEPIAFSVFILALIGAYYVGRELAQAYAGGKFSNRPKAPKVYYQIRTENGVLYLYSNDGVKIPRQIDCHIDQYLNETFSETAYAVATVKLYVTLVDSQQNGS